MSDLAARVGSSVRNVVFKPTAQVIPRKILIIGTGDPTTEATNALNEPVLVTSPEDVASKTGFGFILHRLAQKAFAGSGGIETWMVQQAEDGSAVQADGSVDFDGSTGVLAGTIALYLGGDRVPVGISAAATADEIATAVAAAVTADDNLPVTAAVDGVTTSQVNFTAKSGGTYGNDISIAFNLGAGESLPTGVATAVVDMASGATDPDIQDALDGLGTGDDANEAFFTDVVHGYGAATATLDAISQYVGEGNDDVGLYSKTVHRPFRSLNGDVAAGSGGLSALVAIGNGRKADRANGIIAVPGSQSHPQEIAALALGIMARKNNTRAEESYLGLALTGIWPGEKSDRWTSSYASRDAAVKAGISPTRVQSGSVVMQNVVTFYHPDDVPVTSNGYRSMRNISILQNILDNVAALFETETWQGITIVSDVQRVTNQASRQKARDVETVKDYLVSLIRSFESNAWIYESAFSIDALRAAGSVVVRTGGDGFTSILKVILSGEGLILDTETQFDTSIAITL